MQGGGLGSCEMEEMECLWSGRWDGVVWGGFGSICCNVHNTLFASCYTNFYTDFYL